MPFVDTWTKGATQSLAIQIFQPKFSTTVTTKTCEKSFHLYMPLLTYTTKGATRSLAAYIHPPIFSTTIIIEILWKNIFTSLCPSWIHGWREPHGARQPTVASVGWLGLRAVRQCRGRRRPVVAVLGSWQCAWLVGGQGPRHSGHGRDFLICRFIFFGIRKKSYDIFTSETLCFFESKRCLLPNLSL